MTVSTGIFSPGGEETAVAEDDTDRIRALPEERGHVARHVVHSLRIVAQCRREHIITDLLAVAVQFRHPESGHGTRSLVRSGFVTENSFRSQRAGKRPVSDVSMPPSYPIHAPFHSVLTQQSHGPRSGRTPGALPSVPVPHPHFPVAAPSLSEAALPAYGTSTERSDMTLPEFQRSPLSFARVAGEEATRT